MSVPYTRSSLLKMWAAVSLSMFAGASVMHNILKPDLRLERDSDDVSYDDDASGEAVTGGESQAER
ncbi:uncharacterized protein AMSG_00108 [Thecamonas trahens ATCC 50062]|uniref:Uncharacterized protein n=1 Tax=Thecamonas trahens ATCC 50062 TaxID=461836 RepID=A0A0L0D1H4_THETB|nr:hypothetical protein AMSG_00108 [Thecamonas trahens ATCC 50062]KNC45990.1 hypothetical protein AMSG_00108 [Thecamonas trahens ATCC 50062]|eukprot:XP_013762970.1 hypothetical protein AMSG_00108 [Thecamonas trahens ATCC 50062]